MIIEFNMPYCRASNMWETLVNKMRKQYYNKQSRTVRIENNRIIEKDGKVQLNVSALTPKQLAERCDVYEYLPPKPNPGEVLSAMVFDTKKGCCTHTTRQLTAEEIAEQEENNLRVQFEAEQEQEREAEQEAKFNAWKNKQQAKTTQKPN